MGKPWTEAQRVEFGRVMRASYARRRREAKKANGHEIGDPIHVPVIRRNPALGADGRPKKEAGGPSLLEKAMGTRSKDTSRVLGRYHSFQHVELALAWAREEITREQAAYALGIAHKGIEGAMYSALRWGIATKTIECTLRRGGK